jgi:hypothetical protein
MPALTVLGPKRPALDLTRSHFRQVHGDITVYGSWWLANEDGPRPCLVLIPTHRQSWQKATPCVVLLEQAWRWSEEIGDGAYAAAMSIQFAHWLGLDVNNASNVFRVRSLIVGHLGDLLAMPPMPDGMRQDVVIGEAKVTSREGGEVVRHHEVIERV